ncbi:agmatine deiminase family protein [Iodobacter fluviatilis]|uniref:Agmatine deiminase n=1 Tax=Iodobacter fluviatilis TaxID=537 RepID=A0A377Q848_9NEIS|nr:agmatine deiminase family protein [Iodobacter fluviatilis]TCU89545.1 agmatine deiminase [Iodobacter fluviatilis]STQ90915.1 Agmatine deiminase [Iodobacter fluviatilis]
MTTRRHFLKQSLLVYGALAGTSALSAFVTSGESSWRMPEEGEPHVATWMGFGPDKEIWGRRLQAGAQDNLATIASAISAFEPVNMLVCEEDYALAAKKCGAGVKLIVRPMDDLWLRDTGAVFVKNAQGQRAAVNFNFNGWGNKQAHGQDAKVAGFMAGAVQQEMLTTSLVLEGGGIEVDGEGTAIITESCVLNANRNPKVSKAQCEAELKRLLGIHKIIWLPGIAGRDITDGHTDFYARFTSPGVVVAGFDADPSSYDHAVTKRHLEILRKATDAKGRKLKVVVLQGPSSVRSKFENKDFAAGYINFYVCNHAVIAPEFGDVKADRNTRDILRDLFPQREVVQLNIDAIAAGGGGIHCTTQQQPA